MTKEAILFKTLSENVDKVSNEGAVHTDVMLEAMEAYAKETSIGFLHWFKQMSKQTLGGYVIPMNATVYSIEQLYELYLKIKI